MGTIGFGHRRLSGGPGDSPRRGAGGQVRLEGECRVALRVCAGGVCQRVGARQPGPGSAGFADQDRLPAAGARSDESQCDQITAFVASLPQPREVVPDQDAKRTASGKTHFNTIGCAECHSPDLGTVKGIYSDLLLHRMGSSLVGGGTYGDPPPELPAFIEGAAAAERMADAAVVGCGRLGSLLARRPGGHARGRDQTPRRHRR